MKHIICILLAALLAFSFSGCQQNAEPTESLHFEHNFAHEETAMGFLIPEQLEEWEEYLKQQLENGGLSTNGNDKTTYRTVITPELQTTQYRNVYTENTTYDKIYYYYPKNEPYEAPYFDYKIGIVVTISHSSDTFDAVMEQLDLTPVDGRAFNPSNNTWYIDCAGKRVSVRFPDSIDAGNADTLDQYFKFTVMSIT